MTCSRVPFLPRPVVLPNYARHYATKKSKGEWRTATHPPQQRASSIGVGVDVVFVFQSSACLASLKWALSPYKGRRNPLFSLSDLQILLSFVIAETISQHAGHNLSFLSPAFLLKAPVMKMLMFLSSLLLFYMLAKAKGQTAKVNIKAALVDDIISLEEVNEDMAAVLTTLKEDFSRNLSIRTSPGQDH